MVYVSTFACFVAYYFYVRSEGGFSSLSSNKIGNSRLVKLIYDWFQRLKLDSTHFTLIGPWQYYSGYEAF